MIKLGNLKFVCTTSYAPWNPSTEVLETMLRSVWNLVRCELPCHIYCDFPAPFLTRHEARNYWQYLRNLQRLGVGEVIRLPEWVGLVGLYREIMKDCNDGIILNVQHDWQFIDPERVDVERLLVSMSRDRRLQYVRFFKRDLWPGRLDRVQVPWDPSVFGVPVVGTNGWGDSPHFATAEHYHTRVKPAMGNYKGPDGRHGVEGPVSQVYRKHIRRFGFTIAQEQWGSFLYGEWGDSLYILHIGRAAQRWRKRRGILKYGQECLESGCGCGMVRTEEGCPGENLSFPPGSDLCP